MTDVLSPPNGLKGYQLSWDVGEDGEGERILNDWF